jgi:CubicO group peptidase (beta-lactamase class C family)
MSHFYSTADIRRGGAPVVKLEKQIDLSIGTIRFKKGPEIETVEDHLNSYPVDAFMVVHQGKIIFEKYNTMYPDDKHIWWSSGKVIGSTLLATLEEKGLIDTKRFVTDYLPELKNSVWETVRVEEALDLATGLDATEHDEPDDDSRTNPKQGWYRWAVGIGMYPDLYDQNETAMDVLRSMKRRKPAFTAFEYNSLNTFVINRLVEAVVNKPLDLYFSECIWNKIGARSDGYVVISPDEGYPLFYGLMNSTLEDKARFGMIFTPGIKKLTDTPILSKSTIDKIQHTSHPEIYGKGFMGKLLETRFGEKNLTNHYQWDAVFPDGDLFKSGFGGQGLYVSPARDLVIVWFGTNNGQGQEETMARAIAKHFETVN